jgi:transposase-like protein
MKETSTSRVCAKVMLSNAKGQELTGEQILEAIEKICKEETTIISDGFSSYKVLDDEQQQKKYGHKSVNHSIGEYYTKEGFHTNGIENFWSILKRGIIGIYHHISLKYLQRYVDEFCFRQNTRLDKNMFNVLLGQCVLV